MNNISNVKSRVISEWNKNAEARHKQILSGKDISYHKVLIPTIYRLVGNIKHKNIIDVGCGSGILTAKLALNGAMVIGVDPSEEMIKIAKREFNYIKNIKFCNITIENYALEFPDRQFDIAISNMSLITIPNYQEAIFSISKILKKKGLFIINITHPCFWNQYRKYESLESFEYKIPHEQKGEFTISLNKKGLPSPTTHFHRPLEHYFQSLKEANFIIEDLIEPYPSPEDIDRFKLDWKVPHFLSMRCFLNLE